jgi:hypothetical protein
MNILVALVSFLLGGFTVIVLEIYKIRSFFDEIREFLSTFVG